MRLGTGGVDIYYIDESMDRDTFVMSAIPVPFMRGVEGTQTFVWEDQFRNVRDWRRRARIRDGIPVKKELKGSKLAGGRGRYRDGRHQFTPGQAARVYACLLSDLTFLQPGGIITVAGSRSSALYGHKRLEALLYAMLQRMRTAVRVVHRTGMVFFDEGHGEYRKLYRKARVHLPTGSMRGGWETGRSTKNMPLDNFTKDANFKQSHDCFFTQLADLVSYAAFLKIKGENGTLSPQQKALRMECLYDRIPVQVINTKASKTDPLGIVRL